VTQRCKQNYIPLWSLELAAITFVGSVWYYCLQSLCKLKIVYTRFHVKIVYAVYLEFISATAIPSTHHLLIGYSDIKALMNVIGLKAATETNAPRTTPR